MNKLYLIIGFYLSLLLVIYFSYLFWTRTVFKWEWFRRKFITPPAWVELEDYLKEIENEKDELLRNKKLWHYYQRCENGYLICYNNALSLDQSDYRNDREWMVNFYFKASQLVHRLYLEQREKTIKMINDKNK